MPCDINWKLHHVLRLEEVPSHIGDIPVTVRKVAAIKELQLNATLSNMSVLQIVSFIGGGKQITWHQFHQYQQNKQSPFILTELTEHKKDHDI